MNRHAQIHTNIFIQQCTHQLPGAHTHTHTHTHTNARTHTHTHTCHIVHLHTRAHTRLYPYTNAHQMPGAIYIYIYAIQTYAYTHTHIHQMPGAAAKKERLALKRLQEVGVGVISPIEELQTSPLDNSVALVDLKKVLYICAVYMSFLCVLL